MPAVVSVLVPASRVVTPARVTAPKVKAVSVVLTVPRIVLVPAVETKPPVKVIVSPSLSPKVTPPVLENVAALVMVPPSLKITA